MKVNEKIKNYIIIGLGALLLVSGIFNTCNLFNYGRNSQGIRDTIERSIRTASYIAEIHTELVRISDQYRINYEQLLETTEGLERNYRELQKTYSGLREYKSTLEQTIRDIIAASNGIANGIDGIENIIRGIRESAEQAQD